MEKIYQQVWIDLPKVTRQHLAKVFGLTPNGIAEIRDQFVVSDGYTNADLEGITKERMAVYVGSDASFSRLWELTLAKVKYELNPPIVLDLSLQSPENQAEFMNILNGGNIKLEPVLSVKDKDGNELLSMEKGSSITIDKFCDKCDSKGVRHKKICPTNLKSNV